MTIPYCVECGEILLNADYSYCEHCDDLHARDGI